ncbi:unnamed protein product, partial [Allacma fusca]
MKAVVSPSASASTTGSNCCPSKSKIEKVLETQSIILDGPERIHCSALTKEIIGDTFNKYWTLYDDFTTLYDLLRRGLRMSNNGRCLGYRPSEGSKYVWLSYKEVLKRSLNFGRGLRHLGLKKKDFVGIYCKNRVEWVLAEQGLFPFSMTSVPLFDTLGPKAVNFEISQAEISLVVVEDDKKVRHVLDPKPECLKIIIHIENISEETSKSAETMGAKLYKFEEVEKYGEKYEKKYPEQRPGPDDIAILNYTSGTGGNPKGVVIEHKNFVAAISSNLITFSQSRRGLNPSDVIISFLPLAHSYEKLVENCALVTGSSIGFFRGDVQKLMDDIKYLRPTVFPCVPRLLNRVYDRVISRASKSVVRRCFLNAAIKSKSREVRKGKLRRNSIWDVLVFRKVQNALGGRVHTVISGGAPASLDILEFFKCALGCSVLEGYGQTETCATGSITHPKEVNAGHVGAPSVCCQIKLIDVPEMGYLSEQDQGEICMRGPHVVKRYLKSPEEFEDVVDDEDWIHTGDVGKWLPNGVLKIIDRKNNFFKLSQGEFVAPERIETVYAMCHYVSQIFVYGLSTESYLVGIVVPNIEAFRNSHPGQGLEDICRDPNVKPVILENLTITGKDNSLLSFEQVKDIHLCPTPFSDELGLITPTFKLKRSEMKKYFHKEIED